jgi:tetratricopeptide (TPR) repeat protein
LKRCREHGQLALAELGQYVPRSQVAWTADTLRQGIVRGLQAARNTRSRDEARARVVAGEVGRVILRITEAFYFSLQSLPIVWSSLRLVNQCAPAGPSPMLAQGYIMLAVLASAVPAPALAAAWCRRALAVAETTGSGGDVASILSRTAVVRTSICQWDEAIAALDEATHLAEQVGNMRLWAECVGQKGLIRFYSGDFEQALVDWREAYRLGRRGGNEQIQSWGLMGQGDVLVRLGRIDEAVQLYDEAFARVNVGTTMRAESICVLGMCALAHLRAGDERAALERAEGALDLLLTTRPIVYFLQHGLVGATEVLLRLAERRCDVEGRSHATLLARARQALAYLRQYSRRFPLGRAHASLWRGLGAWIDDRPQRAMRMWRRTIELAESLRTPYELGQAHLEIGRHLQPGEERTRHLQQAKDLFQKRGARREMQRALEEVIASRTA